MTLASLTSDFVSNFTRALNAIHIDHLEMPEAFQTLDNLAGDVLDTFGVFGEKGGEAPGSSHLGLCLERSKIWPKIRYVLSEKSAMWYKVGHVPTM
jgi:hypothetical protein